MAPGRQESIYVPLWRDRKTVEMAIVRMSRQIDDNGVAWVMCPLCFEMHEAVSAREGGSLSTIDGDVYDVCVRCNALEFLRLMSRWCA